MRRAAGRVLEPVEQQRDRDHRADADEIDADLHEEPAGGSGEQEMPEHREHDAEAEDVKRLLAADDHRPRPAMLQELGLRAHDLHGRDREGEEADQPQRRQIGLIERVAPKLLGEERRERIPDPMQRPAKIDDRDRRGEHDRGLADPGALGNGHLPVTRA